MKRRGERTLDGVVVVHHEMSVDGAAGVESIRAVQGQLGAERKDGEDQAQLTQGR